MRTPKFVLPLVFMLVAFPAFLSAGETVNLSIGEWPPYTSEKDTNGKIAEKIVTESFKLVKMNAVYEYHPWETSYKRAKKGNAEGTFPWSLSQERRSDFIFSKEPIIKSKDVFFHLRSTDFKWGSHNDLKKYKIGGTIGYHHVSFLEKNGVPVITVQEEDENFRKLLAGEIDAYPANFIVGYNIIHKLFKPEIVSLFTNNPKSLFREELFMLVSKKIHNAQKLANKFDLGLKKLKDSGRYDEIIMNYLGGSGGRRLRK